MKFFSKTPPREFEVGFEYKRKIKDCGLIDLESDEQVTFKTALGGEYDVTKKNWGFYMGPSLNGRLATFKLSPVLVKNRLNRFFMLLVETGLEASFKQYLEEEQLQIVSWMNSDDALAKLEK